MAFVCLMFVFCFNTAFKMRTMALHILNLCLLNISSSFGLQLMVRKLALNTIISFSHSFNNVSNKLYWLFELFISSQQVKICQDGLYDVFLFIFIHIHLGILLNIGRSFFHGEIISSILLTVWWKSFENMFNMLKLIKANNWNCWLADMRFRGAYLFCVQAWKCLYCSNGSFWVVYIIESSAIW